MTFKQELKKRLFNIYNTLNPNQPMLFNNKTEFNFSFIERNKHFTYLIETAENSDLRITKQYQSSYKNLPTQTNGIFIISGRTFKVYLNGDDFEGKAAKEKFNILFNEMEFKSTNLNMDILKLEDTLFENVKKIIENYGEYPFEPNYTISDLGYALSDEGVPESDISNEVFDFLIKKDFKEKAFFEIWDEIDKDIQVKINTLINEMHNNMEFSQTPYIKIKIDTKIISLINEHKIIIEDTNKKFNMQVLDNKTGIILHLTETVTIEQKLRTMNNIVENILKPKVRPTLN